MDFQYIMGYNNLKTILKRNPDAWKGITDIVEMSGKPNVGLAYLILYKYRRNFPGYSDIELLDLMEMHIAMNGGLYGIR